MTATNSSVPAAVAGVPHLDVDPFSIEFFDDPYPDPGTLREAGPLVYLDKWKVYGVARHAEVHAVLNDPATFCSSRGVGLSDFCEGEAVASAEPHSRGRSAGAHPHPCGPEPGAVADGHEAGPRSLRRRRRRQGRRIAGTRKSFDAIADLAEAYPMSVFPDAMGLKQEGRENLLPYAGLVFNAFGPPNQLRQDAIERSAPHQSYVAEQCQRENLAPDGFGACIHARVDAGDITDAEAPLLVRSLLSAGIDTTVNGIGAAVYCLARFPISWRGCARTPRWRVTHSRKPMRFESPVQTFFRTTTREVEIGGQRIGEGEKVLMFLGAANRDPRRWENPDRYDITRRTSGHVGYGSGIHMCVGQLVARLEGESHAGGAGAQGRDHRDHGSREAPLQQHAARARKPSGHHHAGLTDRIRRIRRSRVKPSQKSQGERVMKSFRNHLGLVLSGVLSLAGSGAARAEISDNVVRVGVLNDISGVFQDTNGMGSVEAARMAAEDFNGSGKNIKVEIVYADHQNKADVGRRSPANGSMSKVSMPSSTCRIRPSVSPSIRWCGIRG